MEANPWYNGLWGAGRLRGASVASKAFTQSFNGSRTTHLYSSTSSEYYTPVALLDQVRSFFGGTIDLDPASCSDANNEVRASRFYETDGQLQVWEGNVWCNPPGGTDASNSSIAASFLQAAISKYARQEYRECLLLLRASFSSPWFHDAMQYPYGISTKQLRFRTPSAATDEGSGPRRSPHNYVLLYFGTRTSAFADMFAATFYIPGRSCWSLSCPSTTSMDSGIPGASSSALCSPDREPAVPCRV